MPTLLISGGLIALGFLAAFGGSGDGTEQTAIWAHISTMFMILLIVIGGLGCLLMTLICIYGLGWLHARLPRYGLIAQLYTQLFSGHLQAITDRTTRPVIAVKSGWAAVRAIFTKRSSSTGRD